MGLLTKKQAAQAVESGRSMARVAWGSLVIGDGEDPFSVDLQDDGDEGSLDVAAENMPAGASDEALRAWYLASEAAYRDWWVEQRKRWLVEKAQAMKLPPYTIPEADADLWGCGVRYEERPSVMCARRLRVVQTAILRSRILGRRSRLSGAARRR